MGAAFYPVFECGSGQWPDDIDGKCLARAADQLDNAARTNRVLTLCDFYSMTREQAIVELLDGDPEDDTSYDQTKLPEEKWFDAKQGLQTLQTLVDCVRRNTITLHDAECVLENLESFERHLADAVNRQVRWHLVVDA